MSSFDESASWAEVAAGGPPQSEEEARANPVAEVIPTESSVESLVDVDSSVSVVPSDFLEQEVKTETQATRIEFENEAQAAKDAAVEEEAIAHEQEEKEKKKKQEAKSYAENPIVAINAVTVAGLSALLMIGAYKKHQAGALTCKLVGLWTVGLAAFGAADFYVSSYLFKKYPPKSK
ncbi:hypothetical protein L873DRAFT_1814837 [Choiromyces venosus 120613-1]|uniref:Uncharacterized protein n=1 Tax=Choiromyces venosus 120613-1 TaxID=1336337 RepID=A0A3N4J741_9PEZI|nr:hypothetical protein L873DRAFT_1814837 [Choiromyces venosus 120613-1]